MALLKNFFSFLFLGNFIFVVSHLKTHPAVYFKSSDLIVFKKKRFTTIIHKIFERNSNFHLK